MFRHAVSEIEMVEFILEPEREHSKLADESAALNEDWLLLYGDDKADDVLSDWMC